MLEFPRWKIWLIGLVIAAGVILSIPSLIAGTQAAAYWPKWMPQYQISKGLDIAGGSHLLLEADSSDALKQRLQAMEDEVQTELRRDPQIDIGDISTAGGRVAFMVRNPTQVDAAVERLRDLTKPVALTGNRDWDVQVVDSTRIVMTPTPSGTAQALKDGYEEGASLEVALRTAVRALEAQDSDRRLEAKSLEVAVLDRNREHRLFRRLPARRIEELLAAGDGGSGSGSPGASSAGKAGPSVDDVDDVVEDGGDD